MHRLGLHELRQRVCDDIVYGDRSVDKSVSAAYVAVQVVTTRTSLKTCVRNALSSLRNCGLSSLSGTVSICAMRGCRALRWQANDVTYPAEIAAIRAFLIHSIHPLIQPCAAHLLQPRLILKRPHESDAITVLEKGRQNATRPIARSGLTRETCRRRETQLQIIFCCKWLSGLSNTNRSSARGPLL